MYKYFLSLRIRMLENMDQKNSGFGHISYSDTLQLSKCQMTLRTHVGPLCWPSCSQKNKVVPSLIITPSISNTFVFISNISIYVGPKF